LYLFFVAIEKKVSPHRFGDSVIALTSLRELWAHPANAVRCLWLDDDIM